MEIIVIIIILIQKEAHPWTFQKRVHIWGIFRGKITIFNLAGKSWEKGRSVEQNWGLGIGKKCRSIIKKYFGGKIFEFTKIF